MSSTVHGMVCTVVSLINLLLLYARQTLRVRSSRFCDLSIHKTQARLLPVPSVPIPAHPDHYILQLAVFHQLHCLVRHIPMHGDYEKRPNIAFQNLIRKALHFDYYADDPAFKKNKIQDHLDHCVDMIRQELMCASDVRYEGHRQCIAHPLTGFP